MGQSQASDGWFEFGLLKGHHQLSGSDQCKKVIIFTVLDWDCMWPAGYAYVMFDNVGIALLLYKNGGDIKKKRVYQYFFF